MRLQVDGLHWLLAGLRAVGIGADVAAARGPAPLALSAVVAARISQCRSLFRTGRADRACARRTSRYARRGPRKDVRHPRTVGVGKSPFLRAGLFPRLWRDDRRFPTLGGVRRQRHALTCDTVYGLKSPVNEARHAGVWTCAFAPMDRCSYLVPATFGRARMRGARAELSAPGRL